MLLWSENYYINISGLECGRKNKQTLVFLKRYQKETCGETDGIFPI